MKKLPLLLLLLVGFSAKAQMPRTAFGFRLGEPLGLNLRYYFPRNKALDVNLGSYGALWHTRRPYGRAGAFRQPGWSFNVNYLYTRLPETGHLGTYYGFGGQLTSRRNYPVAGGSERRTGVGGSGLAGLEYFIKDSAVSVFAELGLYAELVPMPLLLHPQGGLGLRYNVARIQVRPKF